MKKEKRFQHLLIAIATLALVGCSVAGGGRPPGQSAQSDKARVTAPDVPAPDQADLVAGNGAFAFDLYHELRKKTDGNLFYSPYSISLALATTYAGAHGETERQMAETLHFDLPQERLHAAFNGLDLALAGRGEGAAGKDDGGFRLHIVNAIWGQEGYPFLAPFLDTLAENYGAGLRLLEFQEDPEAARVAINDWVGEQTEGRIEDLLPPGLVDTLTRLVLTNAIYFNAAWADPFEEGMTADGPFYPLDGNQVSVPMMLQTTSYGYAEGTGWQAVELPYDGHELSMVIVLPEMDTFTSFEDGLDVDQLDAILAGLSPQQVALTVPKFEIESEAGLADALTALGMPVAFSEAADFSGMDGTRELYIKDVVHKAFVSVDEAGTEAAAATAVVMVEKAMPMEPVEVTVDRPFIFLIRDIETGTLLFVGRVVSLER